MDGTAFVTECPISPGTTWSTPCPSTRSVVYHELERQTDIMCTLSMNLYYGWFHDLRGNTAGLTPCPWTRSAVHHGHNSTVLT